ncbi:heat shock 70 kDa protein 12B-like [Mya arenaria]|uniref:heat shock 70 kDa protein 12B-like n=1 Tax=Mya arenaria TaxID=6604 RepID=UPI0022E23D01|nr:heat shock 70 kDa protein 12B-like [Mya arenaria]
MSGKSYLLCAAIDFGTTFSGYAFSSKHEFEQDPLKVCASSWMGGSRMTISLKTSSTVLFRPDKSFDSFGFEAEDRYSDLCCEENHKDWYYFRRFKMMLYNSKDVHRSNMLKDETGKEMPAIVVFAASIKYMKEHLMRKLEETHLGITTDDMKWVLTVPAIWDDAAKQFMREAAVKAGIEGHRLSLALEPEAASMFCKHLPVARYEGKGQREISCFKPGSKYLVLDAGGGTIDITVHEVNRNGTLRELYKANGGTWGGTTIDKAFIDFISSITGPEVMDRFRSENQEDYMDLLREFEVKKRAIGQSLDSRTTFKIPITLYETFRDVTGREIRDEVKENKLLSGKVAFAGDKMRVEPGAVKELFSETTKHIIDHLKGIFADPTASGADTVLMVGGFSESPMLRETVQEAFPDKRVIVPHEAGLAVLKGAVIFGHNDKEITARIAKYTYGLKTYKDFDPKKHPKDKMFLNENKRPTVRGCFSRLVEIGQTVSPNEPTPSKPYFPTGNTSGFTIKLYASSDKKPMFVDDPGCFPIGEVYVHCVDKYGKVGSADVSLIFGGTELKVRAVDSKTKEERIASFDFLA